MLGEGGFGQVFLAEKDGEQYACKRQSKQHICERGMQKMAVSEVLVMEGLTGCKRTVQLLDAFEDQTDLYMILELCTYVHG